MSDPTTQGPAQNDPEPEGPLVSTAGERVMPWLISMLAHAAVILFALFVVWLIPVDQPEEQPVVPTVRAGLPDRPALSRQSSFTPDPAAPGVGPVVPETPADRTEPNLVLDADPFSPLVDKSRPEGSDPTPRADRTSIFEIDPPPGERPAESVVYLIDASGSMVEGLPWVIAELGRALRGLDSSKRFNIVFFRSGEAVPAWSTGLRPATWANVQAALGWAGGDDPRTAARGASHPLAAIRLAMRWRPDAIWLLSDNITGSGRFALEPAALIEAIDSAKRRHRADHTRVHTIQFLRPDPHNALGRIAEAHGGVARRVDVEAAD